MILIELRVQGTDLALSERVIQRRVNLVRGNVHTRGSGPVNDEILGEPSGLLISGNVCQLRLLPELVNHSCGPGIEFRLIGIFKRVLELVPAGTIVNRQILHRLHVEMYAVHYVEFGMETVDYS